ncbi:MAG: hypothetical protein HQK96_12365 [Nitrospirae bacterium]|nr:hypothetical protein [Nitrospirota bacterium]
MERLKSLLAEEGFLVVFAVAALLLFNWHIIASMEKGDGLTSYKYLFGAWATVIFMLYLVSRSYAGRYSEGDDRNVGDSADIVDGDVADLEKTGGKMEEGN